jgi:hypothetical protein
LGGNNITAGQPASPACSAQRRASAAPYAATPGITVNPSGAASTAVVTTRARSSGVRVGYSPSEPLGVTPWQPCAASQATCSAYRS